jgi:RNA-splicing ligase RtcB
MTPLLSLLSLTLLLCGANGFVGLRRMAHKIGLQGLRLTQYVDSSSWFFNESIPKDFRSYCLNVTRELSKAQVQIAEAQTQITEAQMQITEAKAQAQIAEAKAEAKIATSKVEVLGAENALGKMIDAKCAANPRAVMEYVEAFVMAKLPPFQANSSDSQKPTKIAKPYTSLSRREKWAAYFQDPNGQGPYILQCILSKNPLWEKSADRVAGRLCHVYDSNSDRHHSTSHEINADRNTPVWITGSLAGQLVNAIICIGENLGLTIEVRPM